MESNPLAARFTLSNGVGIPCLGFGTFNMGDGAAVAAAVKAALDAGYRHIDAAARYGNEADVGRGILESGVPREDIFVTSKLINDMHGYENTHAAFKKTLADLGLSYLDLYLIHWPKPFKFRNDWAKANAESWKAFEELYADGKIRAIGVSNFRAHHLDALAETAKVVPLVNQIRLCPGEYRQEIIEENKSRGLLVEAYSPLARGATFAKDALKKAAAAHGKTPAQICIRWCLQHGCVPLPKSSSAERIKENADVFDFELSAGEMAAIDAIEDRENWSKDPDTIDF
ncbi:MAG: aldo/keto reductase [Candidatus Accumulibacter sp.]|jgi:diketogulonate reductase-like aldo/keto reductase|nr:aldo/keto reductase [Accumulibacter sp.]